VELSVAEHCYRGFRLKLVLIRQAGIVPRSSLERPLNRRFILGMAWHLAVMRASGAS
jgi:hypothetical protein